MRVMKLKAFLKLFINSTWPGSDYRSILKRTLIGVNSELYFSKTAQPRLMNPVCLTIYL